MDPDDHRGMGTSTDDRKEGIHLPERQRSVGDKGNDYVYNTTWKDGLDCSTKADISFPDGSKLEYNCVLDVKTLGGDSTNVAPLEFDMNVDGKPEYTPAPSSQATLEK